jgi:hypothetical protein
MKELLEQVKALVRSAFSKAELATVQTYGGEFSSAEIDKVAYNCPAVFVTVLGWEPARDSRYFAGVNVLNVQMAAFIATKHAKREVRMELAMLIASKLAWVLRAWRPMDATATGIDIAPLDEDVRAENLYGRAMDAAGQALWLVRWQQAVMLHAPLPEVVDWLRADIENLVRAQAPAAAGPAPGPAGNVPVVTDKIAFGAN